jgi:hypothetical protein
LLDDAALTASSVVANNTMNRERGLSGANSYAKELGFDPYEYLASREGSRAWLDLCCGSGKALFHAAGRFAAEQPDVDAAIVGIDLVDHFLSAVRPPGLELIAASVSEWTTQRTFRPEDRLDAADVRMGIRRTAKARALRRAPWTGTAGSL